MRHGAAMTGSGGAGTGWWSGRPPCGELMARVGAAPGGAGERRFGGMTRTARGPIRSFHVERWFHVEHRRGMAACRSAVGQRPGPARRRTGSRSYLESRWRVRRGCRADTPYVLGVRVFSPSTPAVGVTAVPWFACRLGRRGPEPLRSGLVRVVGSSVLGTELHATGPSSTPGCAVGRHGTDAWPCGSVWLWLGAGVCWGVGTLRPRVRADDRRRCRTRLPVSVDPGCGVPGWFCAVPACSSTAGLA